MASTWRASLYRGSGAEPLGGQGLYLPEDILRSKSSISAVKIHNFVIFSNICVPPLMKQTWQSAHSDKAPGA